MSTAPVLSPGATDAPRATAARLPIADPSPPRRTCWGLVSQRVRWGLSLRGWLVLFGLLAAASASFVLGIYPFLAVTDRESTDVLVVEGWVHEYAIRAATAEFSSGGYGRVFSTGGPVQGMGGYQNDYSTAASVGAGRLRAAGIPPAQLQMVPSRVASRDRTYSSALALRDWLRANGVVVRRINVVTEDLHARRTRLLFQEALGDSVSVGVIAVPTPDYDARHWWRYSEGVRAVLGESIAYLYAKFLFTPSAESAGDASRP
jgi:uncharacterized SAM-binding protein YcdF (DUF218 family)